VVEVHEGGVMGIDDTEGCFIGGTDGARGLFAWCLWGTKTVLRFENGKGCLDMFLG